MAQAQKEAAAAGEDYAFEDEQGEHWGVRLLREVLEVAVLTLLLFVAVRLLVQNYRVEGPSMQPTLHTSEYILVDKAEYYLHSPQRGDVVVFNYPRDVTQAFVKRVIGLPGDTVAVAADGAVSVNGTPLQEPYVSALYGGRCDGSADTLNPETWQLSVDQYFVLGDNRGDSSDSRCWGPVPRDDIIGKAALVYWPLPDLHALPSFSDIFAGVRG